MLALMALVEACHENETLALYESSVCASMQLCFNHSNSELQILAAQCLCLLLKYQEPTTTATNATVTSVYSTNDYAKFAPFYTHVLRMACRNPPTSVLQQAKDLFQDSSSALSANASIASANVNPPAPTSDGSTGGKKKRRTKDLAELDIVHASAGGTSLNGDGPSTSDDRLKQAISLWRSRYFGLKALLALIRLNHDAHATTSRLNDIIPTLLVNFPKTRRTYRDVKKGVRNGEEDRVDETFKPLHTSHATDGLQKGQLGNETLSNAVTHNNSSPKDDAASIKTGITLHHVQLLAYLAFQALCRLPNINLHFTSILRETYSWLDQSQSMLLPTATQQPRDGEAIAAGVGSNEASQQFHRKKSRDALHSPTSYAWEDLYFARELFIHLILPQVSKSSNAASSGLFDILIMTLLQHIQHVDEHLIPIYMTGFQQHTGSRRASRMEDDLMPTTVAASGDDHKPLTPAAAATGSAAPSSSLAQDLKGIFNPKKRSSKSSSPIRSTKLVQIAILRVLDTILSIGGGGIPVDQTNRYLTDDEEEDENDSKDDDSISIPSSQRLSILHAQIVLEHFQSHLIVMLRNMDLLHKSRHNQGHQPTHSDTVAAGDHINTPRHHHTAANGDHDFASDAHLDREMGLSRDYINLLTGSVSRHLLLRLGSFVDLITSLTSTLNRSMKLTPTASDDVRLSLINSCYSMSLAMLLWSGANEGESSRGFVETNLTAPALFETLLHSAMGLVAIQSDPSRRANGYKILQNILIVLLGFGGSCLTPAVTNGLGHHRLTDLNTTAGASMSYDSFTRTAIVRTMTSETDLMPSMLTARGSSEGGALTNALPSTLDIPSVIDESLPTAASIATVAPTIEPTPSPPLMEISSASSLTGSMDAREKRLPIIFAQALETQSSGNGQLISSPSMTGVRLAAQEHRWLLSLIWYELTASFATQVEGMNNAVGGNMPSSSATSLDSALPPTVDPSLSHLLSHIIKSRGRGMTNDENVILCLQLLLLMLQRLPAAANGDGAASSAATMTSSSNDSLQSILHLQLPMLFALQSYLRSPTSEEKFYLPLPDTLRLHAVLLSYFMYLSKLLISSVDNLHLRHQGVALEELLTSIAIEREKRGEGRGCSLAPSLIYGLVAVVSSSSLATGGNVCSEISTHLDMDAIASIMARTLVTRSVAHEGNTPAAAADIMDETLDARIANEKSSLLNGTFEPFSLSFILPDAFLRGDDSRETSQSWAPSGRPDIGGAIAAAATMDETTRIGGGLGGDYFGGGFEDYSTTPRLQAQRSMPNLMSPHQQQSHTNSGVMMTELSPRTQSQPQHPHQSPQPSIDEIMAEMDQHSFQGLAAIAAKTVSTIIINMDRAQMLSCY